MRCTGDLDCEDDGDFMVFCDADEKGSKKCERKTNQIYKFDDHSTMKDAQLCVRHEQCRAVERCSLTRKKKLDTGSTSKLEFSCRNLISPLCKYEKGNHTVVVNGRTFSTGDFERHYNAKGNFEAKIVQEHYTFAQHWEVTIFFGRGICDAPGSICSKDKKVQEDTVNYGRCPRTFESYVIFDVIYNERAAWPTKHLWKQSFWYCTDDARMTRPAIRYQRPRRRCSLVMSILTRTTTASARGKATIKW